MFATLKVEAELISEAEEKVKEGDDGEKQAPTPPTASVTQQEALSVPLPTSPAADRAKDMPTTPRTPAMQRFHNTLSLVEAEVIELRENKLQEDDTVQKLKEEMKQFREESRASIAKLESRMDKLSQTNDDLRYHLSTTREELEQREQLVIMSSASREHVHQLGTTQAEPETSITSMASTTQPDDTAPASQSAPAQPRSEYQPPSLLQPRQSPTTAILIDSNGKFLVPERLFPRHQAAVSISTMLGSRLSVWFWFKAAVSISTMLGSRLAKKRTSRSLSACRAITVSSSSSK
ncbi:unnamed protein product [Coregonus sp. 'balchen']|nr:unnamed protein product [Coregonus sp. 'balchen']